MENQVIVKIDNEIEGQVLSSILDQDHIPYILRSFHDSVLDGLFQYQHGWGQIEASPEYAQRIQDLFRDMDEEF